MERETHLVKRYGPVRLYDTATLKYVDIAELRALAAAGREVTVLDAKTEADITDSILRLAQ